VIESEKIIFNSGLGSRGIDCIPYVFVAYFSGVLILFDKCSLLCPTRAAKD